METSASVSIVEGQGVEEEILSTEEMAETMGIIGNTKAFATNPTSDYRELARDYNKLMRMLQILVLTGRVSKKEVLAVAAIEKSINSPE